MQDDNDSPDFTTELKVIRLIKCTIPYSVCDSIFCDKTNSTHGSTLSNVVCVYVVCPFVLIINLKLWDVRAMSRVDDAR